MLTGIVAGSMEKSPYIAIRLGRVWAHSRLQRDDGYQILMCMQ